MKKNIVYYYYWPNISDVAESSIENNYFYTKTKLSNGKGIEYKSKFIYYRAMAAKGKNDNLDSVWESLSIKTEEGDYLISEANYDQSKAEKVSSGIVTSDDKQSFLVTGAKGKYKGAKEVVVEYDNNLTKPFTPDSIKNHPFKSKFRKVTIKF